MSNDITTPVNVAQAFTPRPDTDTSSMYGYASGSAEFKPNGDAPVATPVATPTHDVDSSSMRGFSSTGPVSQP